MSIRRKPLELYIFGIWFLSIMADPIHVLSKLPIEIFQPVGILHYLPSGARHFLAAEAFLWTLKILTLAALFLAVRGKRLWPAGAAASVLLTVYQGIVRGFGYINHDHLPLLFGVYLLTLFSFADERTRRRDPEGFQALEPDLDRLAWLSIPALMLICYSFLGAYRLVFGGTELFMSDALKQWIFRNVHRVAYFFWWDPTLLLAKQPWIYVWLKAGFPVATIVELLSPLCLFYGPARWVFLGVMLPFFFLNMIFMNIPFWQNFLVCLLVFMVPRVRSS